MWRLIKVKFYTKFTKHFNKFSIITFTNWKKKYFFKFDKIVLVKLNRKVFFSLHQNYSRILFVIFFLKELIIGKVSLQGAKFKKWDGVLAVDSQGNDWNPAKFFILEPRAGMNSLERNSTESFRNRIKKTFLVPCPTRQSLSRDDQFRPISWCFKESYFHIFLSL